MNSESPKRKNTEAERKVLRIQKSIEATKKLRGSGNGRLVEALLADRAKETFSVLAAIDDFEAEVESLRHNDDFIAFLDARADEPKMPFEEAKKRLLALD